MSGFRNLQRGVGTLAVSTLLLFGTTIVIFYLNRGVIFEQKTSANQLRSTAAFEAAEAGLEWATGMLNRPFDIQPDCTFDTTTNISFRKKYVQTQWNAGTNPTANAVPATNVFPGCYINAGALVCSCPDVPVSGTATAALTPPRALPSFTVSFAAVASDPLSVRVTSVGCDAISGACTTSTATAADSTATVQAILKFRRILRAAPAAALTCGSSCGLSGSFNVVNYDASVNGITVNAGTSTSGATSGTIGTVPGIPPENSVIANDSSLSVLSAADPTCTNDTMFGAYFGSTIAEYAQAPATATVTSKAQFLTQLGNGYRSFYFPSGADLQGTAFNAGTQNDPVTIVVNGGDLNINSQSVIYGLIFGDNATAGSLGTGSSQIYGALVTCNAFTSNGNGVVAYDGKALSNAQLNTATLVRVPGSWRDF
jgi:hypothetical protein